MKNAVLLLVTLASGLGTAQAQCWQAGVRAGLGASGLYQVATFYEYPQFRARLGVSAGGFVRYQPGRHFAVQPELLYTLGGYAAEREVTYGGAPARFTTDLHSLALPVLASYQWHGAFVEAGPQLSWLVGARQRSTDPGFPSRNATDAFPRFEAAAAVGAGWRQQRGLVLGLRYVRGLSELFTVAIPEDPTCYQQSLQLYAGYTFGRTTSAAGH